MAARSGAMHVARNKRTYVAKSGERRVYESVLVRRTYRDGGKVRHETLANLSALPAEAVAAIEATLERRAAGAGRAGGGHHRVAAARARRRRARDGREAGAARPAGPGRPAAGPGPGPGHLPGGRPRAPSCPPWPGGTTPRWAPTWASPEPAPTTSTRRWTGWRTGRTRSRPGWPAVTWPRRPTRRGWRCSTCPPRGWRAGAARWPPAATPGTARKASCRSSTGCSPTRKAARSRSGCFPGNTGDPAAFTEIAGVVRDKFGLAEMVMVGDRGMITSARIAALNQQEDGTAAAGRLRVDHRAARPGHQEADGRRRPAAAVPVR